MIPTEGGASWLRVENQIARITDAAMARLTGQTEPQDEETPAE